MVSIYYEPRVRNIIYDAYKPNYCMVHREVTYAEATPVSTRGLRQCLKKVLWDPSGPERRDVETSLINIANKHALCSRCTFNPFFNWKFVYHTKSK